MNVFNEYSRYYDLLYRDKDYDGETEYVHNLIQSQCPGARTVLSLGCGTGRHDRCLRERGYAVTGVDLSEEMITSARQMTVENGALNYVQGDVRSIRLGKTFDAVISLFHVMSYQVTNDDLVAAFTTARCHMKPEGVFIFDCWYGPGVLTERPVVRVKELQDEAIHVTRIAQPVMHPNENVVDVNYHLIIRDLESGGVCEVMETHRMRYLFIPEIKWLLADSGFELQTSKEWQTAAPLDLTSWNAVFISKNNDWRNAT